jgi:hypothetical protein
MMYVKMVPYFKGEPVGMAISSTNRQSETCADGYAIAPRFWEKARYKLGRGYGYSCMEILGSFEEVE